VSLKGAIAVAGFAVRWMRDNLGVISTPAEIGTSSFITVSRITYYITLLLADTLAAKVETSAGVVFVPAFSGLFAPHWRSDARGALMGLTQMSDKRHIARATLEATAFQTAEVLEAMKQDSKVRLKRLLVDGGTCCCDFGCGGGDR
jgi:glycerol kinase